MSIDEESPSWSSSWNDKTRSWQLNGEFSQKPCDVQLCEKTKPKKTNAFCRAQECKTAAEGRSRRNQCVPSVQIFSCARKSPGIPRCTLMQRPQVPLRRGYSYRPIQMSWSIDHIDPRSMFMFLTLPRTDHCAILGNLAYTNMRDTSRLRTVNACTRRPLHDPEKSMSMRLVLFK